MESEIKNFEDWQKEMRHFSLPRWEDLPEFDLYMDQMVNFIEKYLSVFKKDSAEKLITPSMINNYVKLDLMPKPVKKRYTKKHVAFLIAITILKQVLTISEIKVGLVYQANLIGTKESYDLFCEEQEKAIRSIFSTKENNETDIKLDLSVKPETLLVKHATIAAAAKLYSEIFIAKIKAEKEQ
ncbi:DUF1836 domain-containing protein [Lacticigenium naphthae]|uniref:DUF1836 domain-containing protein n=1 Tax=Lacticigenium naphthae TaxID=515351 RepID=UPI00041173B7|nr:DUF1836 domain-containing protein [Lacticigenium naphthae]